MENPQRAYKIRIIATLQTFILVALVAIAACSYFLVTCGGEDHNCFKLKQDALLLAAAAMVPLLGAIGTICHAEKCVGPLRYKGAAIQVILGIVGVSSFVYMITRKEYVETYIGEWMFAVYCFALALYANLVFIVFCSILCCAETIPSADCEKYNEPVKMTTRPMKQHGWTFLNP